MGRIGVAPRGRSGPPRPDQAIAALATRQHGLVTRAQLVALGLSSSAIDRRLAAGRLHPIHRGVYAVGHPLLSRRGSELAAVLACGPGAVLSHRPAGALWDILGSSGRPHVTARRSRGAVAGIIVHRSRGLHPGETTVRDGVPCTTWARTLLDLAPSLPASRLVRVLEATVLAGLYDHHELTAVLRRAGGHGGVAPLRCALAQGHHLDPARTRSALEDAFPDLPFLWLDTAESEGLIDHIRAIEPVVVGPARELLTASVTKLLQSGAIDLKKWVAAVDLSRRMDAVRSRRCGSSWPSQYVVAQR